MAAQLPVVAPASGGVLTYANSENAWLPANTPESFAETVLSVDADPTLRSRKVRQALRTAQEFSWLNVMENYFRTYDDFYCQALRAGFVKALTPPAEVSAQVPGFGDIL
jgi:glycosyltransferase involved in cell wall biosynthesis